MDYKCYIHILNKPPLNSFTLKNYSALFYLVHLQILNLIKIFAVFLAKWSAVSSEIFYVATTEILVRLSK